MKSVFLFLFVFSFELLADGPKCFSLVENQNSRDVLTEANAVTPRDLLARLVLAEGLSTNYSSHPDCRGVGEPIFQLIAFGVMNRVRLGEADKYWEKKFGKGIRGVIFKPSQFNPAVSKRSNFSKIFLCPSSVDNGEVLWKEALAAADKSMKQPELNPFIQTLWEKKHNLSLVSHFYYPLSLQATSTPPSWAQTERHPKAWVKDMKVDNQSVPNRCIWFFRHESARNLPQ